MKQKYTLAAHLVHSGLQMIWKRIKIVDHWHFDELYSRNKDLIARVSAKLSNQYDIKISESDSRAALEMLIESLKQNDPQYYYVLIHQDSFNQGESINTYDEGQTFTTAKPGDRMSLNEAHDQLFLIQRMNRGMLLHIEKRFWKDYPYQAE